MLFFKNMLQMMHLIYVLLKVSIKNDCFHKKNNDISCTLVMRVCGHTHIRKKNKAIWCALMYVLIILCLKIVPNLTIFIYKK